MTNYAKQIEKSMNLLLSGDYQPSFPREEALSHLVKARQLLENSGYLSKKGNSIAKQIDSIIQKTATIDEADIEVSL